MIRRENGVVLTYVNNLDELEDCIRRGGYDAVKVITGWGVDQGGWSSANKTRLVNMVPRVVVRTVAGDPSTGEAGTNDFPDPDKVQQEIAEWYAIRPDIYIEIGNEPNITRTDDDFFWKYRYFLASAVQRCRQVFPKARLIAPAPIIGEQYNPRRFCEINRDAMNDCDFIGMHVYEYYGFHASQQLATTNQLKDSVEIYQEFFGKKPWYITEYGINDSGQVTVIDKGQRYGNMVHFNLSHPQLPGNVKGALYYHIGMKGDLHPEYHIYPNGDEAYCRVRDEVESPSFGVSFGAVSGATSTETFVGMVDSFVPQIAEMIAALVEWEHQVVAERAESSNNADRDMMLFDYVGVQRAQALRAVLEVALNCVDDKSALAQQLMRSALGQIDAWHGLEK